MTPLSAECNKNKKNVTFKTWGEICTSSFTVVCLTARQLAFACLYHLHLLQTSLYFHLRNGNWVILAGFTNPGGCHLRFLKLEYRNKFEAKKGVKINQWSCFCGLDDSWGKVINRCRGSHFTNFGILLCNWDTFNTLRSSVLRKPCESVEGSSGLCLLKINEIFPDLDVSFESHIIRDKTATDSTGRI